MNSKSYGLFSVVMELWKHNYTFALRAKWCDSIVWLNFELLSDLYYRDIYTCILVRASANWANQTDVFFYYRNKWLLLLFVQIVIIMLQCWRNKIEESHIRWSQKIDTKMLIELLFGHLSHIGDIGVVSRQSLLNLVWSINM